MTWFLGMDTRFRHGRERINERVVSEPRSPECSCCLTKSDFLLQFCVNLRTRFWAPKSRNSAEESHVCDGDFFSDKFIPLRQYRMASIKVDYIFMHLYCSIYQYCGGLRLLFMQSYRYILNVTIFSR
jgi:hypothetical protein